MTSFILKMWTGWIGIGCVIIGTVSCEIFTDPGRIYNDPEVMPQPKYGFESFQTYLIQNLTYPEEARKLGVTGKVLVQFVVTETGSVIRAKVLEGIGHGCDEEALRVIRESGTWTPGQNNGKPVKVRLVLPLNFVIDSDS